MVSGIGCYNFTNARYGNNLSKPFLVMDGTPSLGPSNVNYVNYTDWDGSGLPFVLFDNQNDLPAASAPAGDWAYKLPGQGYNRLWDIHAIRDMAMCGFYVQGPGPSFFQRMLNSSHAYSNSALGIETILTGKWAGGANDTLNKKMSRLDWEFYGETVSPHAITNSPQNVRVKGMSGCKDMQMCSTNANVTQNATGRFRMTGNDPVILYSLTIQNSIDRYGLRPLICKEDTSGVIASSCGVEPP
ncbi:Uncharacterised protein [uncultured archaeon]|nr:Uncharacterised protein [uncultured archaeon]